MEVGQRISLGNIKGTIRYVGEYHEKPGIWVGIELDQAKGKNNGTIHGKKYFECPNNTGLFITLTQAQKACKLINAPNQIEPSLSQDFYQIKKPVDTNPGNSQNTSEIQRPFPNSTSQTGFAVESIPPKSSLLSHPPPPEQDTEKFEYQKKEEVESQRNLVRSASNPMTKLDSTRRAADTSQLRKSRMTTPKKERRITPDHESAPSFKGSSDDEIPQSPRRHRGSAEGETPVSPRRHRGSAEGEVPRPPPKERRVSNENPNPIPKPPQHEELVDTSQHSLSSKSDDNLHAKDGESGTEVRPHIQPSMSHGNMAILKGIENKPVETSEEEELKAELSKYVENYNQSKKQFSTIVTKSNAFIKELSKMKADNNATIDALMEQNKEEQVKVQLECEQELISIEESILQTMYRTKQYLELADFRKAEKTIEILSNINEEHEKYIQEMNQLLNAQRINISVGNQSVNKLTYRLRRCMHDTKKFDAQIDDLKEKMKKVEEELATKKPEWKSASTIREQLENLEKNRKDMEIQKSWWKNENEQMRVFLNLFTSYPFVPIIACLERIKTKSNDEMLLHFVDSAFLVFGGYVTNESKFGELMNSLKLLEENLDQNNPPPSYIGITTALQNLTYIPLDLILTSHYVLNFAKDGDEQLLNLANLIKYPMHPAVLTSESESKAFGSFVLSFKEELEKEERSFDIYIEQIDVFVKLMELHDPIRSLFEPHHEEVKTTENTGKEREQKIVELKQQLSSLQQELSTEKEKFAILFDEYRQLHTKENELTKKVDSLESEFEKL